jgi:transcription antitermination factor NusG
MGHLGHFEKTEPTAAHSLDPARRSLVISASHPTSTEMGAGACRNDSARWYCIRTDPNAETLADVSLTGAGFTSFLPLLKVRWQPRAGSRFGTRLDPLFRGYIFIRLSLDMFGWQELRRGKMRGFAEWVRMPGNERPSPVAIGFVEGLPRISEERGGKLFAADAGTTDDPAMPPLNPGDTVLALVGPFAGFEGLVLMSNAQRVTALMSFFGREARVALNCVDVAVKA